MKTKVQILVTAFLSIGSGTELCAQGYIAFNNLPPASGLVYLYSEGSDTGTVLLNQDVNFQLLGGSDPFNRQVIHTWLLSDGSASGINVGLGRFNDPSHSVFEIPGVQPGGIAYLAVLGWTGDYDTWEAALRAGAAGVTVFPNMTGSADAAPSLTGMFSMVIGVPEPSVLVLTAAAAIGLLVYRRCTRRDSQQCK